MTERLEEGFRAFDVPGELHDVDDRTHQVVVDYPTDGETCDTYRTAWKPGVFAESFRKIPNPPMVWDHRGHDLIGRGVRAESLPDRARLVGRFSDFEAVPRARQAFAQIRDGDVPGWSFFYTEGRTTAHPSLRSARLFTQAMMRHFGPVMHPSIADAKSVGIRSEEGVLEVPTIEEIFVLQDRHVLDEDGVRAMIAEHHPHYREHIKVTVTAPSDEERLAGLLAPLQESGLRDMVIHIGSDGTVTTDKAPAGDAGSDDGDDDMVTLAQATDAALDEACRLLDAVDVTSLPNTVQQAVALMQAAGVAVDELLETLGVADPDENGEVDDTGDRAILDAAGLKKLSDSDFAYIDSKGGRHLPIQDAAHVRNALARFDQTQFDSDQDKAAAKAKIAAAAKKFGVDTASGKRSDDGGITTTKPVKVPEPDIARALEKLGRR